MTIGIYFIEINDLYYIGQSVNIEARFYEHNRTLKLGQHFNYKIQDLYNKGYVPNYGILDICEIKDLDNNEIAYIKEFDSINNGLNITPGGLGTGKGPNHSSAKYSKEQIIISFKLMSDPNNKLIDISNNTGVSTAILTNIAKGKLHTWLQEEFGEQYLYMLSIRHIRNKLSSTNSKAVFKVKPFKLENKKLNIIEEVSHIKNFAKKYNIYPSSISMLKNGKVRSAMGWTNYVDNRG
jgi:hypothetical protein